MALRLVEAVLPPPAVPESPGELATQLGEEHGAISAWAEREPEGGIRLRLVVDSGKAEALIDELESSYGERDGFRVLLMEVEATIPRPEEEEDGEPEAAGAGEEEEKSPRRIAREELRAELADSARPDAVYLTLTALSAVVCAFGLLTDDVAVVIGAMVIAPLLGPLVALSLAATLADGELARRGFAAGTLGLGLAFVLSVATGVLAPVDPEIPAVLRRSTVDLADIGLALAAGSAGTLAFTAGTAEAVIGVMVAVALVPPLVASGLLLGAGHAGPAVGAALLTATNLICVNLAGVVTFLAQGVRPTSWWEAERARRSTRLALAVWTLLLLALVALILLRP